MSTPYTLPAGQRNVIDWIEPNDIRIKCWRTCIDSSNLLDVSYNWYVRSYHNLRITVLRGELCSHVTTSQLKGLDIGRTGGMFVPQLLQSSLSDCLWLLVLTLWSPEGQNSCLGSSNPFFLNITGVRNNEYEETPVQNPTKTIYGSGLLLRCISK